MQDCPSHRHALLEIPANISIIQGSYTETEKNNYLTDVYLIFLFIH